MSVCIAGMHRSGTSMVARLLSQCGLYLGEQEDLMQPSSDNPEGFWENIHFVALNDEIFAKFSGGWDLPPSLQKGWEKSPELASAREKAARLIDGFKGHEYWGWKDPRSSLTIPFWKTFSPEMKTVICLRNPLDVAKSLHKRGYSSNTFGFNLWLDYNRHLIDATTSGNRLITHYDAYFYNPYGELKRILDFLNMSVPENNIEKACKSISTHLRHNRFTKSDLIAAKVPQEVLEMYDRMCSEAGPIYLELPTNQAQINVFENMIENLKTENEGLKNEIESSIAQNENFKTENEGLKNEIEDKKQHIFNLERFINVKDQYIWNLEKSIKMKDENINKLSDMGRRVLDVESMLISMEQSIHNLEADLARKDMVLNNYEADLARKDMVLNNPFIRIGLKFISYFHKVIDFVFPKDSSQRAFVKNIIKK
ncbi:MAG: sulfotransferase [Deltaproteobacteria bacterium]|nr:sulfotransferase [Deltaproteobacteria bacterium]